MIIKEDTNMRKSITARVRLAVTLRYIASGDSYHSLEFLTRISRKTIGEFIPEVLGAIYQALKPKVIIFHLLVAFAYLPIEITWLVGFSCGPPPNWRVTPNSTNVPF